MAQSLPRMLQTLMLTLARATNRELARSVEYLKAENQLLRARIAGPIRLTPYERAKLIKYGLPLGPELKKLMTIVRYDTFRRWVRIPVTGNPPAKVGRPRTPDDIRQLVVKLASETGWGVTRIVGELKKLGVASVSRTTVRNILREHGLGTGPERGQSSWDQYLRAHAETLWACDFLSKRVITRYGIRTCYALVFMHVESKRVIVTASTTKPTRHWTTYQAYVFLDRIRTHGMICPTVLLRDVDGKFGQIFDAVLRQAGCTPERLPPRFLTLNAFVK